MATRPNYTISVCGGDGESGHIANTTWHSAAREGHNGKDGAKARTAGAGGAGGHLTVLLRQSASNVGAIYVQGIGNWAGTFWEAPAGHDLMIDAHGGRGGDGGHGQHGQNGGIGYPGRDADRDWDAQVCFFGGCFYALLFSECGWRYRGDGLGGW